MAWRWVVELLFTLLEKAMRALVELYKFLGEGSCMGTEKFNWNLKHWLDIKLEDVTGNNDPCMIQLIVASVLFLN